MHRVGDRRGVEAPTVVDDLQGHREGVALDPQPGATIGRYTIVRLIADAEESSGRPPGVGFMSVVELLEPEVVSHPDPGPGRLTYWARRVDGGPMTPAIVAYIADLVPLSVSTAMGVVEVGTSLDNTIRVDPSVQTDWVLLDLRPNEVVAFAPLLALAIVMGVYPSLFLDPMHASINQLLAQIGVDGASNLALR